MGDFVSAFLDLNAMDYAFSWSDSVSIKNEHSEVLALSSQYANRLGFRNPIDALGATPFDISRPIVEIAPNLVAQDRAALTEQKSKTYLALVMQSSSEIKPRITVRQPVDSYIVSNHKTLHTGLFAEHFYRSIQLIDRRFYRGMQATYEVIDTFDGLTERETQVMYYLLLGMNSAQISQRLRLSQRTVQHYVENIKDKMGCNTTSQLVELALYLGFNAFIPESLLK